MKKLFSLAVLFFLITGIVAAQISRGQTTWISAKTVTLKSSTGFFASNRGTVSYGDEMYVLQISGKWAEVRSSTNSSLTGWMASANITTKRVLPSTGSTTSASEVALAGKGFNQEVEDTYKAGGSLNYADVDRTEAIVVSQDELFRFVTEGRLATGE
jgi:hypothetical protein